MQFKLPTHKKNSYKGQVGKVLIIGGNEQYYGASIFTAVGAENSGADLITLFLPSEHIQTAKNYSLNFFLHTFKHSYLSEKDTATILEVAHKNHVLMIGNGLGKKQETKDAILKILNNLKIPAVIDADALLPEILKIKNKNFILTPHHKEFERVFNCSATRENVKQQALNHSVIILLKGPTDIIVSSTGQIYENKKTCPEMRVGGTGDVLAGIVGSFISQRLDPFIACCSAAYYFSKCGEKLLKKSKWLSAHKIATNFSDIVNSL